VRVSRFEVGSDDIERLFRRSIVGFGEALGMGKIGVKKINKAVMPKTNFQVIPVWLMVISSNGIQF